MHIIIYRLSDIRQKWNSFKKGKNVFITYVMIYLNFRDRQFLCIILC